MRESGLFLYPAKTEHLFIMCIDKHVCLIYNEKQKKNSGISAKIQTN